MRFLTIACVQLYPTLIFSSYLLIPLLSALTGLTRACYFTIKVELENSHLQSVIVGR